MIKSSKKLNDMLTEIYEDKGLKSSEWKAVLDLAEIAVESSKDEYRVDELNDLIQNSIALTKKSINQKRPIYCISTDTNYRSATIYIVDHYKNIEKNLLELIRD